MNNLIRNLINRLGFDIVRMKKQEKVFSLYDNFPHESLRERRFYNIGAGSFKHPYWTNIDFASDHYKSSQKSRFINYNLIELKKLPIEENTAEIVYSSHTIEHVSDEAVINMIKESYRILKPGGGLRLTTPDALLEFKAYQRKDINFWYWVDWYSRPGAWEKLYKIPLSKASIHQLFLDHFASQLCEIAIDDSSRKKYTDPEIVKIFSKYPSVWTINYFTKQCKFNPDYPGYHINWWTHDKLISILKKAGFSECYSSGYGQSSFSPLRDTIFFDNTHPAISLYVEAIK